MKNTERNGIINQVVIIWWEWKFWEFAWNLISQTWIKVVNILENTTEQEKQGIINNSQVIIFSVPISQTVEIIKSFADMLTWDKLVMDFTWLKSGAVWELKKLNVYEIVWTHPMFWPFWDNLRWKKIIFSEEKTWKKWKFVRRLLKKSWANLINLSPEEHDKKMAIIQALTHILNFIFIKTIKDLWFHPNELEQLQTPIYELQALISWRFLTQGGNLYADMQIENQFFLQEVLPILTENLSILLWIDLSGDKESFIHLFYFQNYLIFYDKNLNKNLLKKLKK